MSIALTKYRIREKMRLYYNEKYLITSVSKLINLLTMGYRI